MATELQPPPGVSGQATTRLVIDHQEAVTRLANRAGGRVLLRVGGGCVILLPSPEAGLAATALLNHPRDDQRQQGRARAALHLGSVTDREATIADPTVSTVRKVLQLAGPGEVVLSPAFHSAAAGGAIVTAPILAPDETVAAHRLLIGPPIPSDTAHPTLPGWLLGGAVILASATLVGVLVALLLST